MIKTQHCPNCESQAAEIERLRAALKRIAGGWPKPMQLARETLEKKK
jgi:hypothetical protein